MSCKCIWTPGRDLDIKHCSISCLHTEKVQCPNYNACLSKYSCKLSKLGTRAVCTYLCVSTSNILVQCWGHSGVNPSAALACPLKVKHANKHTRRRWLTMHSYREKRLLSTPCLHVPSQTITQQSLLFLYVIHSETGTGEHTHTAFIKYRLHVLTSFSCSRTMH